MIPGVVPIAIVVLLGAADRDLELPHLVVRGTPKRAVPLREFWPFPLDGTSTSPLVWELPIPASTQTSFRSFRRMNPSPPPVGFSVSAGGGPWNSRQFTVGLSDEKSGIAVEGWSFEGEEIHSKGIRGSALIGGRWGSLRLDGWHPYDEYKEETLSPDWAHGELLGRLGIGRAMSLALRVYSTTADGDPGHIEGSLFGRLSQEEYGYKLMAGDRVAGAHLRIDRVLDWLNAWVGAKAVDDGSDWRYKVEGEAALAFVRSDHVHLAFGVGRHLRLTERAALRRAFVLMVSDQEAVVEDLDWRFETWCALRLSSQLTAMARFGQRRFESLPLWYSEDDSLYWHAIPSPASGLRATAMMHWGIKSKGRVSAGFIYDGLEREDTDSLREVIPGDNIKSTGQWPLLPPLLWWVEVTYGDGYELRLRFERDTGRETLQGTNIESSTTARGSVSLPLTSTLCAWAEGAYSWGWELNPLPRRALSVGVSWSLRGFTRQEAAF